MHHAIAKNTANSHLQRVASFEWDHSVLPLDKTRRNYSYWPKHANHACKLLHDRKAMVGSPACSTVRSSLTLSSTTCRTVKCCVAPHMGATSRLAAEVLL